LHRVFNQFVWSAQLLYFSVKKMSKKIIVIGSGFAGLAAACHLASAGMEVTVLEKNESIGGRARAFDVNGFRFDMGPSWYWMPDVFEDFFKHFGKKTSDYYQLTRLDPSYRIYFGENDIVDLPATMPELEALFEKIERGSSLKLRQFLLEAEYKYRVGIGEFVQKPSLSIFEFADFRILSSLFRLQMFSSIASEIRKLFKNEKIRQILEFPVLFLGATPEKTPALYSLMNYADMVGGTWYPMGGMHEVIKGMEHLACELGAKILLDHEVTEISVQNGQATSVICQNKREFAADFVVGGADYHHIEQKLLPENLRNYSEKYWENRVMAPSSLLYYVGVNKKVGGLLHHTLFFDRDFGRHAQEIYESPKWPTDPLFYIGCPSKTDNSVAPEGFENLFLLVPVAPGLEDSPAVREKYYNLLISRLNKLTGQRVGEGVIYRRTFAHQDFVKDYHAFKGNAYGLANTLMQTAFLKPSLRSKKVKNLFFSGQLTVPGPGVPPSLISGEVVAREILKAIKNN
jgi:phytoene desaturase